MTSASPECAFCGLPVRSASPERDATVYCCLGCRFAAAVAEESGEAGRVRWTLARLGLAIFFSMNVMMFAMALWSRDWVAPSGVAERELADAFSGLLRQLCFVLTLPVLFLLGFPLAGHVVAQWRERRFTTDGFLLAGVVASFVYSVISLWRGHGTLYFEVTCMVLVAVTLGRWLEAVAKQRTHDAIDSLQQLLPERVVRVDASGLQEVALTEIEVGDRVRYRAGDRIAVDGRVLEGRAAIDRQFLTGESEPVLVQPGDEVAAGEVDLDGTLTVEVTRPSGEGSFATLVELVRDAARRRTQDERLADRVAAVFLPLVALLATGLFAWQWAHGDWGDAVQRGLSVVLIACPCALGLATPLAIWAALGRAARRQILIRDGDVLGRLAGVRTMAFDKTGTLTSGRAVVERVVLDETTDADAVDRLAAWLTLDSHHPHARAIATWCRQRRPVGTAAENSVRTVPGLGLAAECDGIGYRLGSPAWFERDRWAWPGRLKTGKQEAFSQGASISGLGWNEALRALFVLSESPREGVEDVLDTLRRLGIDVVVLTGDAAARAEAACGDWNVEVRSGLLPHEKTAAIDALRKERGMVAMVGDGLNDAPALAAADVGIAVHAASDLARQTADVCLLGDDLERIPELVRIARDARRAVRFNLFWAFAYNSVGMIWAVAGRLHPIVAALAMLGSSLLVVGRSLYLGRDA